jgi:hypothetical protein
MGKKRRRDNTTAASRREEEEEVVDEVERGNKRHITSTVLSSSLMTAAATASKSSSSSRKKKKMTNKMKDNNPPTHPSISISKVDHDTTLQLLSSLDWEMAKNTSRRNVIRPTDAPRNAHNTPYCQSFIFGPNMKDPNNTPSYWSIQYPDIYTAFQGLMTKYNPHFRYTHITVNKNLRCKRHTDGGNAGLSYIAGFGNYTGGELIVEEEQQHSSSTSTIANSSRIGSSGAPSKPKKEYKLDLKSKFVLFNGKTQPHETCSFSGDRYTLVYYTSEINTKTNNTTADNKIDCSIDRRSTAAAASTTSSSNDGISSKLVMKFQQMKAKLNKKFK